MELDSAALLRRAVAAGHAASEPATATTRPLRAVASIGPLGQALATAPAGLLEAVEAAAHDGAGVVVATTCDLARPELEALSAAGTRTLLAVGLVAHAERHGVLLLAGRNERAVAIDDLELLELLAAHAATCLRTAELMRSLRAQAATDPLTGLGHHATFHETLAHAHRRPQHRRRARRPRRLQAPQRHLRPPARRPGPPRRRGRAQRRAAPRRHAVPHRRRRVRRAAGRLRRRRGARGRARACARPSRRRDLGRDGLDRRRGAAWRARPTAPLLARADRALYRVKDAGRDGVAVRRRGEPLAGRPAGSCSRAPTAVRRSAPPILSRGSHGRPGTHPQLLDHRPHRPREVDAGRPHPRDDEDRRRPVDARPGARLDGPRARARHHDQGPGGARLLHRAQRRDLPAAPHRHARPRGLHLRGEPQPRRVRGRAARRRREPGRRGPDAREHLPRRRRRARAHPVPEQDRPAGRRARARGRGGRRPARRAGRLDPAHLRQDGRGRRGRPRGARREGSAADAATPTPSRAR